MTKRIDCRTSAGKLRLSDAQYTRYLDLLDVFAVPYAEDAQAQTEAQWQQARADRAQLDAAADARQAWPDPRR
jgi:multidrug resistance efflux pump